MVRLLPFLALLPLTYAQNNVVPPIAPASESTGNAAVPVSVMGAVGGAEVALPSKPPEIRNPSGVNMGSLSNLQQQMNKRVDDLEENVHVLEEGFDDIETHAPSVTFTGVDLRSEVVDPQAIMKQIEAYEKEKAARDAKKPNTKEAAAALIGELTPPIIILEAPDVDPLERHLMMKLITCREDEASKEAAVEENTQQEAEQEEEVDADEEE